MLESIKETVLENVVDIYIIHALRDKVQRIYEELHQVAEQLASLEKSILPPAEEEFRAIYPRLVVDTGLFALVGSQPARTLEQDKADLREILAVRF